MLQIDDKKYKSPNFNDRRGQDKPSLIILHYTGMKTAAEALERLCDPESQVSAHYVIDEKGQIFQLVEEEKRAWHAGVSYWAGQEDINSASIGIELVNPGHEFGYRPFGTPGTDVSENNQLHPLVELCKIIMGKYGIEPANVLAHSDVAPSRKVDPGHLFPWAALAAEGIGLWPQPEDMDRQAAADLLSNPQALHELLAALGYAPHEPYEEVLRAFMRHYHPGKFANWDDTPTADAETAARLLALTRAHNNA